MSSLLDTVKRPVRCDYFLTIVIKFLVILSFFRKNVLLTAKIKNTIDTEHRSISRDILLCSVSMLVALESFESLYQEFDL